MKFIYCLILLFVSSCLVKDGMLKDNCEHEAFSADIAKYSKAELTNLLKTLESRSFRGLHGGCKDAIFAKIHVALGNASQASDYFSKAAKKLPELSDYFLLAKADCELKKQKFDEAHNIAKALLNSQSFTISPQYAFKVRQILADIAVKQKDDFQIIKTHEDLLSKGYQENEVLLFNLAVALSNIGEHEKANDVYKKLLVNFPTSPGAMRAEEIRSLSQYNLDLKEMEKHFDNLIKKLAFEKAVKDAEVLAASPDKEVESQSSRMAVKAMVLNNQMDSGLKLSKTMAHKKNATARSLESHAWALAKAGRFIEAADFYNRFINATKDKKEQAKGCFFRGFSFYEASLYSMALFSWQTCQEAIKDTDLYEDYLWYQALSHILNENHAKAVDLLRALYKLKSPDIEKYSYFLAFSLEKIHKKQEAHATWSKLAGKKEPTYYVLLARLTLGLNHPKGEGVAPQILADIALRNKNNECKNVLLLFHLGFKEEARDLLLNSKIKTNDKVVMLQHMGFYHEAWQRSHLVNSKPSLVNNSFKTTPKVRAAFPMPHRDIVANACRKYGVGSDLLYAIIKTESGFSNTANSYRGALGLMQMMPFVAQDLVNAKRLDIDHKNLSDPQVSIELGAMFIAILKRQFNDPFLVAAAYNAGPHQVQKWLDQFGHLPKELMVERFPFKQTRDYVKKVLPSESIYRALNGQDLRLAL
jgi:hypothetical protein